MKHFQTTKFKNLKGSQPLPVPAGEEGIYLSPAALPPKMLPTIILAKYLLYRKLFDLADETAVRVVFHSFSARV